MRQIQKLTVNTEKLKDTQAKQKKSQTNMDMWYVMWCHIVENVLFIYLCFLYLHVFS